MNKTMKRMNDFGERKYIFCRGVKTEKERDENN